jgi:hypothetical protein
MSRAATNAGPVKLGLRLSHRMSLLTPRAYRLARRLGLFAQPRKEPLDGSYRRAFRPTAADGFEHHATNAVRCPAMHGCQVDCLAAGPAWNASQFRDLRQGYRLFSC